MADDAFIQSLPKAELHLHIEGTLEPDLMSALAQRNGVALPYKSAEELHTAYNFGGLQDFLDLYYQGMSVLQNEQDFYDLTWAYLEKVHAQNVRHVEIFFDPQGHTSRGISFATVVDGIHSALLDAEAKCRMTSKLILCFLRHLDEDDALVTFDQALAYRGKFIGVGLDSSERGNPPAKFQRVFERARGEGFHLVAHAGEEGPADYVRSAIDDLHVQRIDHGNNCLDDPGLVERLVAAHIPLTMCPLSNLRLRVIDRMTDHPLRRMMDLGLFVTVNSDDPAYFGGYVNENYAAVQDALDLSREDVATLARNSFEASFLEPDAKAALMAEVDAVGAG